MIPLVLAGEEERRLILYVVRLYSPNSFCVSCSADIFHLLFSCSKSRMSHIFDENIQLYGPSEGPIDDIASGFNVDSISAGVKPSLGDLKTVMKNPKPRPKGLSLWSELVKGFR